MAKNVHEERSSSQACPARLASTPLNVNLNPAEVTGDESLKSILAIIKANMKDMGSRALP